LTVLLIHDIIKTINFFIWGTPFVIKKDKLNKGNCAVPQSLKPKENRMKKVLLALVLVAFLAVAAFAETTSRAVYKTPSNTLTTFLNTNKYISHTHQVEAKKPRLVVGIKADAPNLVRFTKNLTLGVEGGKEMYNDLFMDHGYATEDDKGYFAFVKVTFAGTLFDFSK